MNNEIHEIHENRLIFADEVYAVQGAIYEVYKTLGAVILVIGSTLVTIAALSSPKEYKGDGSVENTNVQ